MGGVDECRVLLGVIMVIHIIYTRNQGFPPLTVGKVISVLVFSEPKQISPAKASSHYTLPKTKIVPENRPSQKERIVFQPPIFLLRRELLVSLLHAPFQLDEFSISSMWVRSVSFREF